MLRARRKSPSPRYIAFAAISIDGRISLAKDRLPDWTSKEDKKFFQTSLAHCDAVIVGRNTYYAAAARLRRRITYVLTSRVSRPQKRGSVTFVNPAITDIAPLLSVHRNVAILGGAAVYQYMLERDLLHEFYITVEPLLFGRGIPLLVGGTSMHTLRLLSVRKLNSRGTLLLHYKA
ncbi:dihydrofolate reductase family protein [Candidatus Uhrbacteria bacterium]|nr:dihydrofolate reductase family protein [Candidatus Uhrbacteria bacterium]